MKTFLSILLFTCAVLSYEGMEDVIYRFVQEIHFIDNSSEGESDSNSSEEFENDSEIDEVSVSSLYAQMSDKEFTENHSTKIVITHFKEIPDPPPDHI